ncbi:MAG: glycerophosphodiester phosphodiesterase [Bacteroidia bacterium]|nr:glycerophosphodiester phosphodiesterase [Bacteroidia bacterium]
MSNNPFLIHGHRGCRGLMPENSIPGFLHAIELGCRSIEMDVVISKDKQVIVSHEPYMSKFICLDANKRPIPEEQDKSLNLYEMDYESIKMYDCGSVFHSDFSGQQKMQVHKPSLADLIDAVNNFIKYRDIDNILYNIEIKSKPELEGLYQPPTNEFVDLVLDAIEEKKIGNTCIIQSFDESVLKRIRSKNHEIPLASLFKTKCNVQEVIQSLGFTPNYFSPNYTLIDKNFVEECKSVNAKVLSWTVNDEKDIEVMLDLEVDGIITDYPNRAFQLLDEAKMKIG